jgi:hypothetical protein
MALAVLKKIDCAEKIMLNKLPGTRGARQAGKHTWVCCGINHKIRRGEIIEVASKANVAVNETHSLLL